ncbi:MAG: hypothetical protein J6M27_03365 [Lachnospiraceae bacterium]|nr:hypothetical protein [Lachnospiraceae bacterium]
MNKADGRLFHKGAYKDALHRLSFPVAAITALLALIEIAYLLHVDQTVGRQISSDRIYYSFVRLSYPMILVFLVVSPALLFFLFAWQNRQAGSDCILALPITKKSFALTNALAVLTIDAGILLFEGLLLEGLSAMLPNVRMGDENSFFLTLGCYMAGAVFTMALMLLALSLSGTWLSTLCMYVILLVVPRLMLLIWELYVFQNTSTFDTGLRWTILDWRLNIVTGLPLAHIGALDYATLKSVSSLLYTLIVGIMIGILAIYLYTKRPAETAGHPAVSDRIQGFFRAVLGCSVCLIPLMLFWNGLCSTRLVYATDLSSIIAMFLLAVAVYMLYELIHTRSLHCCIKALPGVLYLLAFCVIFTGAVWYGKQYAENDYAQPEQVNSISLTYQPVFYYAYSGEDDYYCCEMRDYEITDREVIGILCEALNKEMRHEGHDEVCEGVRLVINGGVFFSHRDVSVEQSDMERIFNILGKDESYRDIFLKPVDREQVASIGSSENRDSRNGSVEETDILYKVYCDVVADYEKEEFAKIVHRITRQQIGGKNLLTMRLKDGRKMVVYQQESDENAESDAFMDLRTTEGEQELVKLAFPEVEDTPSETLAIVRVDFCNMTPHFTKGGEIDEISAIKISNHIWSTDMALTPTGWDRLKHSGSEEFYDEYINELYQRICDGSNWEVTDSSLPYIQVCYIVRQYVEGEEEARMLKEVNSSYRLNPEVFRWLGAQ